MSNLNKVIPIRPQQKPQRFMGIAEEDPVLAGLVLKYYTYLRRREVFFKNTTIPYHSCTFADFLQIYKDLEEEIIYG